MNNFLRRMSVRTVRTAVTLILQFMLFAALIYRLSAESFLIYALLSGLSYIFALGVAADDIPPAAKTAWLVFILLLPAFGWSLYFLYNQKNRRKKLPAEAEAAAVPDKERLGGFLKDPAVKKQCEFLSRYAGATVYTNCETSYFSCGEQFAPAFIEKLEGAQRFIFIEYFIITKGRLLDGVLDILKLKARSGVDVRILYDDIPAMFGGKKSLETLREFSIKICKFNKLKASADIFNTYRDHRKITVIDGEYGFIGGLNLADEYINYIERFGYWKDAAMMISGEAVNGLTKMFLEMWEISNSKKKKFSEPATLSGAERFFGFTKYEPNGITVPFGDSPLYNYSAGEAAYLNIINGAEEYIWISTPYLILDYEMVSALTLASRGGVDVKIIVPAVPDKKYVQMVTRQNYRVLLDSGIEIYEFSPGFVHSKLIVADGKHAVIGSINFDFQSFHMLFESGAYMYQTSAVAEIAEDLSETFLKSKRIYRYDKNKLRQFFPKLIKLLSPFM